MGSFVFLSPSSPRPATQCRRRADDRTISELSRHHGRPRLLGRRDNQGSGLSSRAYESDSPMIFTARQTTAAGLAFKKLAWPSPDDDVPFWKRDFPVWNPTSDTTTDVPKDPDPLHIIHVTAEMAPVAKVGGLGDVVTGLSRASLLRGHRVEVMLPFYECIQKHQVEDLTLVNEYKSYHNGDWICTRAYSALVSGIPVILIEPANQFFKGQSVYGGCYNELEAYLFFSRACLEWMQVAGVQSDIIHVHEWQTAGLPILYWDMYHNLSIKKPRIILTIHNMEHYGECRMEQLNLCGLDGSAYAVIDKAVDDRTIGHNPERLSLLKGGIVYSNAVVTVSPTYLNETLCSGWLASTLLRNREKYFGILNGIDTAVWNPTTDVLLPADFSGNFPSADHEELSHMLYAAADMVLVPSMYEPCGLAQMIGMRYGAVCTSFLTLWFVFEGIDEGSLNRALERAFTLYNESPSAWADVVSKVVKIDNSWNSTARKYIEVYNSIRVR
ncbi:unnamed protein product [Victoria cruziana]